MKRILLFLICFTALSFSNNINEEYNFIGKWKGEEKDKTGYFIFEKDGTASIKINNDILGGKDYYVKGKKGTITYIIDNSTKLINIDLIMHLEGHEKTKKLSFIAEIIDNNSFKIGTDFNENRPLNFSENNSMILTRVQE
ncbi:hypothetical protein [Flavobacterium sp.]|uniref:hypothetical protein n=1 Tax=Flavobacterium sp. TaxID=239 RepID=UPI0037534C16